MCLGQNVECRIGKRKKLEQHKTGRNAIFSVRCKD